MPQLYQDMVLYVNLVLFRDMNIWRGKMEMRGIKIDFITSSGFSI
jgi:hypothetical protein